MNNQNVAMVVCVRGFAHVIFKINIVRPRTYLCDTLAKQSRLVIARIRAGAVRCPARGRLCPLHGVCL